MRRAFSRTVRILESGGIEALVSETGSFLRRTWSLAVKRAIWATSEDHTEAYRRWMDYKVRVRGPKDAVGGFDQGIGSLQAAYLHRAGLEPGDRLLDIGSGSLRAGRFLIDYLAPGNYTGMDINPRVIEAGKQLVGEETLAAKDPTLLVNEDLRFRELEGDFDHLIAQSVFTHLPPEKIRECFQHVPSVMHAGSTFHFTFFDPERQPGEPDELSGFHYSEDELAAMAQDAGLAIRFLGPEDYDHPNLQRMARVELPTSPDPVPQGSRPAPLTTRSAPGGLGGAPPG